MLRTTLALAVLPLVLAGSAPALQRPALGAAAPAAPAVAAESEETARGAEGAQPAPGELGFYNGAEWVPVEVDPTRLGVRLDPELDAAAARALVAGLEGVDPREALRLEWAGHAGEARLLRLATRPGTDAAAARAAAARLSERPGVRSASPGFLVRGEPWFATERILVRWRADVSAAERVALAAGLAPVRAIPFREGAIGILAVPRGADPLAVANALYRTGRCELALPDFAVTRVSFAETSDPLFGLQWHLEHGGDQDVDAKAAWDVTRGDPSVIVAVIDTGFELAHPDLAPNLVAGIDVLSDDLVPAAEDFPNGVEERHGTAVAGIAAAAGNDALGVTGVAQHCGLMPIRFFSESSSQVPTLADEAEAFTFAWQNGAAVVNASWGPPGGNGVLPVTTRLAIDECNAYGRGGLGCLVFFASGNLVGNISSNGYASYEGVLAVGAVTNGGVRPSYSGWGAALDFCAPSHGGSASITTTDRLGPAGYAGGDWTTGFGGTSAAAPCAAGVAALVISAAPGLTREEVILALEQSADKVDVAGGTYDASGHSDRYGWGRVNAGAAVALAVSGGFCGVQRVCASPAPSSTGVPVRLQFSGSTSVAANQASFFADGLPPFTETVLVYSGDPGFAALGDGFLCLGNASLGFVLRAAFQPSDVFGNVFRTLDLSAPPHPLGQVTAGSTWRFQLWYRDLAAGGAGFNLSDALSLSFCP